jgi:hypothetical protein
MNSAPNQSNQFYWFFTASILNQFAYDQIDNPSNLHREVTSRKTV